MISVPLHWPDTSVGGSDDDSVARLAQPRLASRIRESNIRPGLRIIYPPPNKSELIDATDNPAKSPLTHGVTATPISIILIVFDRLYVKLASRDSTCSRIGKDPVRGNRSDP